MVKNQRYFLSSEIHIAAGNCRIQFVEMFEHPEAAAAMDLGQVKCNMRLLIVLVADQFPVNIFVFEKSKFVGAQGSAQIYSRLLIKLVIFAHTMAVQNAVYHFAALAAKDPVVEPYLFDNAVFAAVSALQHPV